MRTLIYPIMNLGSRSTHAPGIGVTITCNLFFKCHHRPFEQGRVSKVEFLTQLLVLFYAHSFEFFVVQTYDCVLGLCLLLSLSPLSFFFFFLSSSFSFPALHPPSLSLSIQILTTQATSTSFTFIHISYLYLFP